MSDRYGISTTAGYRIIHHGRRSTWEAEAGVYDRLTGQRLATFTQIMRGWRKDGPESRRMAAAIVREKAEAARRTLIAEDRADG